MRSGARRRSFVLVAVARRGRALGRQRPSSFGFSRGKGNVRNVTRATDFGDSQRPRLFQIMRPSTLDPPSRHSSPAAEPQRQKGTVARWTMERGFGFLTPENGKTPKEPHPPTQSRTRTLQKWTISPQSPSLNSSDSPSHWLQNAGGGDLFCHFSSIEDGNALEEGSAVEFVRINHSLAKPLPTSPPLTPRL